MEITQELLQEKIENGDKIIVDFHGVWCQPCKIMKPVFEKLAEEYREKNSEVQLYTMDVDKNKEFVSSLGVRAIPTIKSFANGKEQFSRPGLQMESQINDIAKNLLNG